MSKYIPRRESELVGYADHFAAVLEEKGTEYGVTPEEAAAFKSAVENWDKDFAADIAAKDAAKAARQAKTLSRTEMVDMLRAFGRRIQADSRVSDAARADIGLPVHKTTKTPVAVPTTAPVARVEIAGPLQHRLVFQSDTHRGKPAGVIACRIMMAVSDRAPKAPSDYRFVTQTGRSPYVVTFNESDSDAQVHYILQWVNSREEVGPFSSPVTSTVSAL